MIVGEKKWAKNLGYVTYEIDHAGSFIGLFSKQAFNKKANKLVDKFEQTSSRVVFVGDTLHLSFIF